MKFALFILPSWPEPEARYQSRIFDEAVEQIQYAEELGFDSVWLAEHHFTRFGICPLAPPFAHHVAAKTKTIRVGTRPTAVGLTPTVTFTWPWAQWSGWTSTSGRYSPFVRQCHAGWGQVSGLPLHSFLRRGFCGLQPGRPPFSTEEDEVRGGEQKGHFGPNGNVGVTVPFKSKTPAV